MKISLEKHKFFKWETAILGYIVSHKVTKTELEKIASVTKYSISRNVRELRRLGYYKNFP